jgi:ribosome-associated protein
MEEATVKKVERSDPAVTKATAIEVARSLFDDKCEDVVVLDVQGLSHVSDFVVIASGTSDRQMHSAATNAAEVAGRSGFGVYRRSDDERSTWIVLDCVDIVVHVFEPNTRAHYDLEMMWGDAPRVEWERPGQKNRDYAGLQE